MVVVNVVDSNDNSPEFEEGEYQVSLSDRAVRGQFVAKVRAIDPDEIGNLVYSIIGGNLHQVTFCKLSKLTTSIKFQNGWLKYDHRVMYNKYITSLPFKMYKDILR